MARRLLIPAFAVLLLSARMLCPPARAQGGAGAAPVLPFAAPSWYSLIKGADAAHRERIYSLLATKYPDFGVDVWNSILRTCPNFVPSIWPRIDALITTKYAGVAELIEKMLLDSPQVGQAIADEIANKYPDLLDEVRKLAGQPDAAAQITRLIRARHPDLLVDIVNLVQARNPQLLTNAKLRIVAKYPGLVADVADMLVTSYPDLSLRIHQLIVARYPRLMPELRQIMTERIPTPPPAPAPAN
jgi:hypothetical protein